MRLKPAQSSLARADGKPQAMCVLPLQYASGAVRMPMAASRQHLAGGCMPVQSPAQEMSSPPPRKASLFAPECHATHSREGNKNPRS